MGDRAESGRRTQEQIVAPQHSCKCRFLTGRSYDPGSLVPGTAVTGLTETQLFPRTRPIGAKDGCVLLRYEFTRLSIPRFGNWLLLSCPTERFLIWIFT
jgi:hypothetical protein